MPRPVKRLPWLLLLAPLLLARPAPALACSCADQSIDDAFRDASAVFEGRVIALQRVDAEGDELPSVVATLRVTRTWKGANRETVIVRTPATDGTCGFGFRQDQSFLVYATGELDAHGAGLRTTLCSRSKRVEDASADLTVLGAGVTPVDIVDEPAVTRAQVPPQSGGCAGCAVSGSRRVAGPAAGIGLAVVVAAVLRSARRRRR